MKIFDLLLEPNLDFFLDFLNIKLGGGRGGVGVGVGGGQGIFTPTIYHRLSDKVNKKGTLAKFFISQSLLN